MERLYYAATVAYTRHITLKAMESGKISTEKLNLLGKPGPPGGRLSGFFRTPRRRARVS